MQQSALRPEQESPAQVDTGIMMIVSRVMVPLRSVVTKLAVSLPRCAIIACNESLAASQQILDGLQTCADATERGAK